MPTVLVRTPNWLGDCVMARPFVAALCRHHAGSAVRVVAHPRVASFWEGWPGLRITGLSPDPGPRGLARNAARIRRLGDVEAGYLLSASLSSAAMLALAGVPRRTGFAAGGRSWLLTDPVPRAPHVGTLHYSQEFMRLLPPGTPGGGPLPPLEWSRRSREAAQARLASLGLNPGAYVVLAVGASGPAKRYPARGWAVVLEQLRDEFPLILVGTAGERAVASALRAQAGPGVHNLCGETDIPTLAALLGWAAGFVGVDSGAAHLAAAVDCPVTVLFGPGDTVETRPLGERVAVLRAPLWCAPCRSRRCLRTDRPSECMQLIPPGRVADSVRTLAARGGPPKIPLRPGLTSKPEVDPVG